MPPLPEPVAPAQPSAREIEFALRSNTLGNKLRHLRRVAERAMRAAPASGWSDQNAPDALRSLLAALDTEAAQPSPEPSKPEQAEAPTWRCFHCDEVFATEADAGLHFGRSEYDKPVCQFDAEHIRWMEAQHRRNVDDDSEALRTVRSLLNEHEDLRRKAEELGYARGLADAKKHPEDLGLATLPPASAAGERPDLSQWEKARFGYFDQAGRFVEFSGEDNELPNDSSPRWVGGRHDMQLLRAALAEELSAWDIDPPLHHVKEAHDACEAWLAAPSAVQPLSEVPSKGAL